MEPLQLRPASRDRSASDTFAMRPRTAGEDPPSHGAASRPDENRGPSTLPKGFESMLRTSTETGDIGMFSIKPSRVPQSRTPRQSAAYNDNGFQRPRQNFQPFGVPNVDDRKRLPSYARDATSEVVSMYETASQKSASRVFDDPDYRSYSMTQTSYSAYKLSNHRSYTSLRSQQSGNGPLQRPRSPFAYPTRLKRHGFRPSSPALTDGGVIDYSRRAEIDRTPYGTGHTTSSPSSLYAQKRKPPLLLRQEGNKSTPSLLGQPSPPRRTPSPGLRRCNGQAVNDWARRNGSSGNTSPARSTVSFASTVNLYATTSGTSNATTPGKLVPSSPLYYDYTEDFEVDGGNQPAEDLDTPIAFSIVKTIPEERPATADRSPSTETQIHRLSDSLRPSRSATPTVSKISEGTTPRRTVLFSENQSEATEQSLNEINDEKQPSVKQVHGQNDKRIVRLSGLGYGAQELSTHVEEVFGLLPTKSFEIPISHDDSKGNASENVTPRVIARHGSTPAQTMFTKGSSKGVSNYPPRFSSLPSARNGQLAKSLAGTERASVLPASSSGSDWVGSERVSESTAPSSNQSRFRSSSGFRSMDTGFTELTDMIKTLEDSNKANSLEKDELIFVAPEKAHTASRTVPGGSTLPKANMKLNMTAPVSCFISPDAKNTPHSPQVQPPKKTQTNNRVHKVEAPALRAAQGSETSIFSHPMAMDAIPRSGSPMLAPKPISPARELKLKNSVPQLMKALPPLPPEPPVRTFTSDSHSRYLDKELPGHFSPLLPDHQAPFTRYDSQRADSPIDIPNPTKAIVFKFRAEGGAESSQTPRTEASANTQNPPKLKLKLKSSALLLPQPSSDTNRAPCSGEESYPWSDNPTESFPAEPATQTGKAAKSKTPKFRLKITRASGSTYGTVRINRESGESNSGGGFHLRRPRDLFTSTAGIDNIFRQVSQHIQSRKASLTSNDGGESNPASASLLSPNSCLSPVDETPSINLNHSRPQQPRLSPPPEARSVFSDDSSYIQGHGSMRGKLSNLKARLGVPYTSRVGSRSYDDLTWRIRNVREVPSQTTPRSTSYQYTGRESARGKPLRRLTERMNRHRLKQKVRGWLKDFKEARSALTSRVKSRIAS